MAIDHVPARSKTDGLVHVRLLRWPFDRAEAEALEAGGQPYLLLLGPTEVPPLSGYRFMDWIRSPVDPDELIARESNLEARFILSQEGPRPYFDPETGRLTFAHTSVDVAPSQVQPLRELVNAYREVVPEERLRCLLGLTDDRRCESLAARLVRLRRRVRAVGLNITRVRNVGYALQPLTPAWKS